ncbi:isochorismatase family protein [Dongia soli]|uniref:Isochorismatase family protein n=1 Tax=Dongia soli TaxID=600628 RepID=A0ABU5EI99_9PROT|nr:isochorismatase family protein [Dongia soli]MDY0885066.1 isochorismatase family protein [Dongia soli]
MPTTETDLLSALTEALPIAPAVAALENGVGLVIVDEVNGFATVGAGPLAPAKENAAVSHMVAETDRLARQFVTRDWPILAFLDSHIPGKAEPPYPPHCEIGTGQENLVPALTWLEDQPQALLVRKDCINGYIGAERPDGGNAVREWIARHKLRQVLVVGICTDICVMDFVLTLLSARNHGLVPPLQDILVYGPGCSTYDLPRDQAVALGLPPTAGHPQGVAHHMGLYAMASRGAKLVREVSFG